METYKKIIFYLVTILLLIFPAYLFYLKAIAVPQSIYFADEQVCYRLEKQYDPNDISELRLIGLSDYPKPQIVFEELPAFQKYSESYQRWLFTNFKVRPLYRYFLLNSDEIVIKNDLIRYYLYKEVKCEKTGVFLKS